MSSLVAARLELVDACAHLTALYGLLERFVYASHGARVRTGPLTHADMQALFKPVPFGEPGPVSPLEQAVLLPVWDAFRSIEMDKQQHVLEVSCLHQKGHMPCICHFMACDRQMHTINSAMPACNCIHSCCRAALRPRSHTNASLGVVHSR